MLLIVVRSVSGDISHSVMAKTILINVYLIQCLLFLTFYY